MSKPSELRIANLAKKCARISLLAGISIFLVFAIAKKQDLMVVGAIFLLLAFLANGLMVTILLLHFLGASDNYPQIIRAILIMLFNIPIAIFFAWLSIQIAHFNHLNF